MWIWISICLFFINHTWEFISRDVEACLSYHGVHVIFCAFLYITHLVNMYPLLKCWRVWVMCVECGVFVFKVSKIFSSVTRSYPLYSIQVYTHAFSKCWIAVHWEVRSLFYAPKPASDGFSSTQQFFFNAYYHDDFGLANGEPCWGFIVCTHSLALPSWQPIPVESVQIGLL